MKDLPTGSVQQTIRMPLDTARVRAALNHPDPAKVLGVAIVALRGLTNGRTHGIQLTGIVDEHLTLPDDRTIPLAEPVKVRLAAWVDHRASRWPRTPNPHLFIT